MQELTLRIKQVIKQLLTKPIEIAVIPPLIEWYRGLGLYNSMMPNAIEN